MADTVEPKILKVVIEHHYLIPMHNDKITKINGWSLEEVIEDWFKNKDLNRYHATRESHDIMGGKKLVSIRKISANEFNSQFK